MKTKVFATKEKFTEWFTENYGINIITIDNLLDFTEEQNKAISNFKQAVEALSKNNVGIIMDEDKYIKFINKTYIEDLNVDSCITEGEKNDEGWFNVEKYMHDCLSMLDMYVYNDENLYAKLKSNL